MNTLLKIASISSLILLSSCSTKTPQTSVHARYVPERMDDFAFENDKVAFRVYGPALTDSAENNGTDCWLKRVDYPIVISGIKAMSKVFRIMKIMAKVMILIM